MDKAKKERISVASVSWMTGHFREIVSLCPSQVIVFLLFIHSLHSIKSSPSSCNIIHVKEEDRDRNVMRVTSSSHLSASYIGVLDSSPIHHYLFPCSRIISKVTSRLNDNPSLPFIFISCQLSLLFFEQTPFPNQSHIMFLIFSLYKELSIKSMKNPSISPLSLQRLIRSFRPSFSPSVSIPTRILLDSIFVLQKARIFLFSTISLVTFISIACLSLLFILVYS